MKSHKGIEPGDKVSWRLDYPGSARHFGRVNEIRKEKGQVNFHVTSEGIHRVIPARFITKEVG